MNFSIKGLILILALQKKYLTGTMFGWICKKVFHGLGWQLVGRYPHEIKKKLIIVAPHTSSWDVPLGLLLRFWIKIEANFYVKKEMFRGILGPILRFFGAIPLDRSGNLNLVQAIVKDYNSTDKRTTIITPEGTRKRVKNFKTGFYYIADQAKIPILPVIFDYGNKKMIIKNPFYTNGDAEKEIPEIENLFKGYIGKIPEYSFI